MTTSNPPSDQQQDEMINGWYNKIRVQDMAGFRNLPEPAIHINSRLEWLTEVRIATKDISVPQMGNLKIDYIPNTKYLVPWSLQDFTNEFTRRSLSEAVLLKIIFAGIRTRLGSDTTFSATISFTDYKGNDVILVLSTGDIPKAANSGE